VIYFLVVFFGLPTFGLRSFSANARSLALMMNVLPTFCAGSKPLFIRLHACLLEIFSRSAASLVSINSSSLVFFVIVWNVHSSVSKYSIIRVMNLIDTVHLVRLVFDWKITTVREDERCQRRRIQSHQNLVQHQMMLHPTFTLLLIVTDKPSLTSV
jgi:hypothetical protein